MLCEYCNKHHDGSFASGRFCSRICSRGFSTKAKRKEINEKVSLKQIGKIVSEETRKKLRDSWQNPEIRASRSKPRVQNTIYYSRNTILRRKKIEICEECGIGPVYNNKPLTLHAWIKVMEEDAGSSPAVVANWV